MSYGRIRRGPMAGDAFTQIRNAVFRDPRLSAKAMGIFGNISTHRDGWGITPESLSTQMRDGVDAIKSGLRELEQHGYLQRSRQRRADGTLGASVYFITDQPDAFELTSDTDTGRSEPEGDFPQLVNPPVVEPPLVDHPHKKTSSKKTRLKKTEPPSPPPAAPLAGESGEAKQGGGEGAALDDQHQPAYDALLHITTSEPRLSLGEQELARLAPLVTPWLERADTRVLQEQLTAGLPAQIGSPVGLLRTRLLSKLPPPRPVPVTAGTVPAAGDLPPWCGRCGDGAPAEFNARFRVTGLGVLCHCHPNAF